jgi:hypothetical protein
MYYIFIVIFLAFSALLPFGVIADEVTQVAISNAFLNDIKYDFEHIETYQVDGHSMEHLGFDDGKLVDVLPASDFNVGDVIAFECNRVECDGAYIKEIAGKMNNSCYWVEGRKDIWKEDGKRKQSLDSRTTYGWLCDDDIEIYGVAFLQKV